LEAVEVLRDRARRHAHDQLLNESSMGLSDFETLRDLFNDRRAGKGNWQQPMDESYWANRQQEHARSQPDSRPQQAPKEPEPPRQEEYDEWEAYLCGYRAPGVMYDPSKTYVWEVPDGVPPPPDMSNIKLSNPHHPYANLPNHWVPGIWVPDKKNPYFYDSFAIPPSAWADDWDRDPNAREPNVNVPKTKIPLLPADIDRWANEWVRTDLDVQDEGIKGCTEGMEAMGVADGATEVKNEEEVPLPGELPPFHTW